MYNDSLVLIPQVSALARSRAPRSSPSLATVSVQNFALLLAIALHLALAFHFAIAIAVMIRSSRDVLKLVHRSLVSLSMHIRLDFHDQR